MTDRLPQTSAESHAYIDGDAPGASSQADGHRESHTWTSFVQLCLGCGKTFRASQEAIDAARRDGYDGTDEEIAHSFDFCLGCVDACSPEGEYVEEGE